MAKISFEETYVTTQGWMVTVLGLSARHLTAFALVYGFCQDGESKYTGSLKYTMLWLGCSKPTAMKVLDDLVQMSYLIKSQMTISGVTFNEYEVNWEGVEKAKKNFTSGKETLPGVVKKFDQGGKETLPGGGKETLPNNYNLYNNIDNHIINNKADSDFSENEVEVSTLKAKKETRTQGGAEISQNKRLETAKAVLDKATTKRVNKTALRPINQAIAEGLDDLGMLETWERWRQYRFVTHKFQYFDEKSEKAALNGLMKLARNQSDVAIELIELAINKGWKGFFLPAEPKQQVNGSGTKKFSEHEVRTKFILEYNAKYGCIPGEDQLQMAISAFGGGV